MVRRTGYDILVLGARDVPAAAGVSGVAEPNVLAIPRGGITLDDWRSISELPGIELAAPVAVAGYVDSTTAIPSIAVPLERQPSIYRIKARFESWDGVRSRRLVHQVGFAAISGRGSGRPRVVTTFSDYSVDLLETDGFAYFTLFDFPSLPQLLVGVDPELESRLVDSEVYEPLADVASVEVRDSATFPIEAVPNRFKGNRMMLLGSAMNAPGARPFVIPVVANREASPRVEARWSISRAKVRGTKVEGAPSVLARRLAGAFARARPPEVVRETLADPRFGLPFVTRDLTMSPTGIRREPGITHEPRSLTPLALAALDLEEIGPPRLGRGKHHFAVRPTGSSLPAPVADTGAERSGPRWSRTFIRTTKPETAFRHLQLLHERGVPGTIPGEPTTTASPTYIFAPVGSMNLSEATSLPKRDVPALGLYDVPNCRTVPPRGGSASKLQSTFNFAGLVPPQPGGFTDLTTAFFLRGEESLDAIRVRFAAREGTPERARAEDLLRQTIRDMQLTAYPVASVQYEPVRIEVDGDAPSRRGSRHITQATCRWVDWGLSQPNAS